MSIRAAVARDHESLRAIWLASVRATHRFLSEGEIQALLPATSAYLACPGHSLWVLCDDTLAIGFMGLDDSSVESLFIAPDRVRSGGGRALLAHARTLATGPLSVQVNEQNVDALAFYRAMGFSIVARSAADDQGRPYPLAHMREGDGTPTHAVCVGPDASTLATTGAGPR